MCNTRSNVYLQTMKTYTLSVNTLMRKLTLEHHNNCAPCLGLILPIRWVTPPPNSCLKCFHLTSHLHSLHIWFVSNIDSSSCLSSQCWFGIILVYTLVFYPLQHSLIAMSSYLNFSWSKWMSSDPTPLCASTSNSIYPNHMHSIETVECLLCVLVSRRYRDKHWICFKC